MKPLSPTALRALSAHFGSLRHTLALLALLAAVVLLRPTLWPLAGVIGLLSINLLAALVVHPVLRRQLPLRSTTWMCRSRPMWRWPAVGWCSWWVRGWPMR